MRMLMSNVAGGGWHLGKRQLGVSVAYLVKNAWGRRGPGMVPATRTRLE